jgi:small subunit ribosomal protein S25e
VHFELNDNKILNICAYNNYHIIKVWPNSPPPVRRKARQTSPRLLLRRRAAPGRYRLVSTQKWTKGKTKDKSNNVVFLDKAAHDKIVGELSRMGKLISVSTVVERFKVSGSIARRLIKDLVKTNLLKYIEPHSRQALLVSTAPPKKAEEAGATKKEGDKDVKKAAKKAPKEKEPKAPKEATPA